jgi:hypothetical protein
MRTEVVPSLLCSQLIAAALPDKGVGGDAFLHAPIAIHR